MTWNSFSTFSSVLESWNRVVSKLWKIISETATWFAKKKIQITIFEIFWIKNRDLVGFFKIQKMFFFNKKIQPQFFAQHRCGSFALCFGTLRPLEVRYRKLLGPFFLKNLKMENFRNYEIFRKSRIFEKYQISDLHSERPQITLRGSLGVFLSVLESSDRVEYKKWNKLWNFYFCYLVRDHSKSEMFWIFWDFWEKTIIHFLATHF